MNDERTSYDVWGAAIALEAALATAALPRADLHLGADRCRLLLAEVGAVRPRRAAGDPARDPPRAARRSTVAGGRSRSMPPPRAGSRPCSSRSTLLAGGGTFWPLWAVATLALALGAHAIVVVALPSLRPQERELEARVDVLTRTRAGALDVQAAELRRIERDLHDGAQARLVALSMQLGRAEERLDGPARDRRARAPGARGGGRRHRRAARPRPRDRAAGAGRPRPGGGGRGARACARRSPSP